MKKSLLTVLLASVFLLGGLNLAGIAAFAAAPVTYYISSSAGDDANAGTSEDSPWKSFANLQNKVLSAGDKVLLKRGDVWSDRLEIMGQGTESAYVEVGSYGDASLSKPTIRQSGGVDDIAVLIKDFYYDGSKVVKQPIRYIRIHDLNIEDTRMGIYIRVYATNNDGSNRNVEIYDCTFNNIDSVEVMEELNKFVEQVERENPQPPTYDPETGNGFDIKVQEKIGDTVQKKITELLNRTKGNLPKVTQSGDDWVNYQENAGGGSEYIFPAAVFVGGKKDPIQPELRPDDVANAKPALQYLSVENCEMNECIAGVMGWFYAYNGTRGGNTSWREALQNIRLTDITLTGAINGGIAFEAADGGAVLNADKTGMEPGEGGWGVIRNFRAMAGSYEPYHTFPLGTTCAIFEACQNFLITESDFSGATNDVNADGCGIDFESDCRNIELSNSVMQGNEGGAILIMAHDQEYHENLFIYDNLMYSNLQSAFAAGENNRINNTEVAYIHVYNQTGNTNVVFKDNVVLMQLSTRPGNDAARFKVHEFGPFTPDLVGVTWDESNYADYYEGSYKVPFKTYYTGNLGADGKIVLNDAWLNSNVFRAMRIQVAGSGKVSGTIIAESRGGLKSSENPVAFSAENGYVDIGALEGVRWNIPYNDIEISIDGGASGAEYTVEFILDTQVSVEKLSDNQIRVQLLGDSDAIFTDSLLPEHFVLQGVLNNNAVERVEKTGLYGVVLTMKNAIREGGIGVTVLPDAYIDSFNKIFSGMQPDGAIEADSWYNATCLRIEKFPQKLSYEANEALDLMGLKLVLNTAEGDEKGLAPNLCEVSGFDSTKPGKQTVTLRYKNCAVMFDVQVYGEDGNSSGGCGGAFDAGIRSGLCLGGLLLAGSAVLLCVKRKRIK